MPRGRGHDSRKRRWRLHSFTALNLVQHQFRLHRTTLYMFQILYGVGMESTGRISSAPPSPTPLTPCRELVYAHSLRPSLEPAFRALTRHLLAPKWEAELAAQQAAEEEARREAALQALLQEEEEEDGSSAAAQVGKSSHSSVVGW